MKDDGDDDDDIINMHNNIIHTHKTHSPSVFYRLSESHLSKNGRIRPGLDVERRLTSVLKGQEFSRLESPLCEPRLHSTLAESREPRLFLCAHDLKEYLDEVLVEIRAVLLNETKIREIKDERTSSRCDFTQGFEQGVHILLMQIVDQTLHNVDGACVTIKIGFRNKSILRSDVTKICTDVPVFECVGVYVSVI